jgi:hypothetical protein
MSISTAILPQFTLKIMKFSTQNLFRHRNFIHAAKCELSTRNSTTEQSLMSDGEDEETILTGWRLIKRFQQV